MIETGRYNGIPRNQRICDICEELEDENHVIFTCPKYIEARQQFNDILIKNNNIQSFLNPSFEDINMTGRLLQKIEALRTPMFVNHLQLFSLYA